MHTNDKAIGLFEKWTVQAIVMLGFLITVFLSAISMMYTEWSTEAEKILQQPDSLLGNLIFLTITLVLLSLIRLILPKEEEALSKMVRIVALLGVMYALIFSLVWVHLSCVQPYADGWYLCVMADLIEKGLYVIMDSGGYLGSCPQQYGLVFILQVINHFSGEINWIPFQIFNALHMPLMVFACYRVVWYAFQKKEICVYYWVLIIGYLPIWMYVPYVYGEIMSITFSMVLLWQALRFCRERKCNLFCLAGTAGIACQLRKNSLIMVVACCLILLLYSFCRRNVKALLVIISMVGGILFADIALKGYYEHISNLQIGKGIPYTAYILMGLQDTEAGPGWYTDLNMELYKQHNYDTAATAAYCREAIGQRLQELMQEGAVDFFYRKAESQWNEPDSHAYYETEHGPSATETLPWLTDQVYMGTGRTAILYWMDRYHFMIYACAMFLAFAMLMGIVKKDIPASLLFVVLIGGFLFSLLWEAKGRYVLPYMIIIVMLSSGGIFSIQEGVKNLRTVVINKANKRYGTDFNGRDKAPLQIESDHEAQKAKMGMLSEDMPNKSE